MPAGVAVARRHTRGLSWDSNVSSEAGVSPSRTASGTLAAEASQASWLDAYIKQARLALLDPLTLYTSKYWLKIVLTLLPSLMPTSNIDALNK